METNWKLLIPKLVVALTLASGVLLSVCLSRTGESTIFNYPVSHLPPEDFPEVPQERLMIRKKYLEDSLLAAMKDMGYSYQTDGSVLDLILRANFTDVWLDFIQRMRMKIQSVKLIAQGESEKYPLAHYKTCAVVSSAHELLGSKLGRHIDLNEAVFRSNNAFTEGFETDVGSKTDFHLLNNHMIANIFKNKSLGPLRANNTFISYTECLEDSDSVFDCKKDDLVTSQASSLPMIFDDLKLHIISPEFYLNTKKMFAEVTHELKSPYPTTGFLSLVLATLHCDVVHAYGFIAGEYRPQCHYYSKDDEENCGFALWFHPRHVEKALMIRLGQADPKMIYGHNVIKFISLKNSN